jgi:hypothetical protein
MATCWKLYNYNGWFNVKGRNVEEAEKKLKEMLLSAMDSIEGIEIVNAMNGAWKVFNFKGWFEISARSESEALKRGKERIAREKGPLVLLDEDGTIETTVLNEDTTEEVDTSYLTGAEGTVTKQLQAAHHFIMTLSGGKSPHEIHAETAKDAWEALRVNYMYDEHVILMQHVTLPVAVSPSWRAYDASKAETMPDRLGHQIVVACGLSQDAWWLNDSDIVEVDTDAKLVKADSLDFGS